MKENKNILEIKNVTVSFDGFKALNSLSLEIKKSQMIAIIGPNGAGKTTLQDVITGKTKIDDGKIFFKNNDLSQFSEHEIVNLGIGRKFQRPTIIENISVWDNLCIALNTRKNFLSCLLFKLKNKDLEKVVEIISIINLEKKKKLIAKTLSGMTEIETKKTSELLINISKDRTVLVVEHDMKFIESLDVEVVVLNEGSLLTRGSMKNIKKNKQVIDVYLGR